MRSSEKSHCVRNYACDEDQQPVILTFFPVVVAKQQSELNEKEKVRLTLTYILQINKRAEFKTTPNA